MAWCFLGSSAHAWGAAKKRGVLLLKAFRFSPRGCLGGGGRKRAPALGHTQPAAADAFAPGGGADAGAVAPRGTGELVFSFCFPVWVCSLFFLGGCQTVSSFFGGGVAGREVGVSDDKSEAENAFFSFVGSFFGVGG